MKEELKNQEIENASEERRFDPRSEFETCVDRGFYHTLSRNEFFAKLQPEEQYDAMQMSLSNCLNNREDRFYRLVSGKPDLAAEYRDQDIKPLRHAISALDEMALTEGKAAAIRELDIVSDEEVMREDLEEAA